MFTDAQIQYLTEVLGTSVDQYLAAAPKAPASSAILVWTPPLNDPQRELLGKILGSVRLAEYRHIESDAAPNEDCRHLLAFGGGECGRTVVESAVWWRMPGLDQMLGPDAAAVTERKKETWTLLQRFVKELLS